MIAPDAGTSRLASPAIYPKCSPASLSAMGATGTPSPAPIASDGPHRYCLHGDGVPANARFMPAQRRDIEPGDVFDRDGAPALPNEVDER